jgi:hypothetical protein
MSSRLTSTRKSSATQSKARTRHAIARQSGPATAQRLQRQIGNRATQHLLQAVASRRDGSGTLQRQTSAASTTRSPQQEYVRDAIAFLQMAAGAYERGQRVDRARLARQLDGWMSMIQTAITFINAGPTGAEVGTTAENLRLAYQRAVSALMNATASQLNETLEALYEQHSHRIHVWAWPAATRPGRTLSASAQAIITNAQDTSVPIDQRAVETVRAIIRTYYPTQAELVEEVVYKESEGGLKATAATFPNAKGTIAVGRYFVTQTTRTGFARRVLQVDHELEHIRQQRRGLGGPHRADLREFLAFSREALAQERSGTGRIRPATRVRLIDAALARYYRLNPNQRVTYAYDRDRLIAARRDHARRSRRTYPPPPGPASSPSSP